MKWILLLFSVFYSVNMQAQISPGVYHAQDSVNGLNLTHELKIDNTYFIHTIYTKSPAGFVKTIGGFYKFENDVLAVKLEFNSNYEEDTTTSVEFGLESRVIFSLESSVVFFEVNSFILSTNML